MDYNDNDYEGQNLHLTGEESSKISVLRPFALPKFDFDDSLHAHLRFDSLVENEVFLGIPSQEDNHWIEDFSRGGNGIEFSSSAAESCALPRHINVWSEATSSESVEMLLKAVGQEEMVPGEKVIEKSDPGDQLGSSTRQMDDSLREDCKDDDVENPSQPPAEVGGKFSRLNQSAGVEAVQTEHILEVKETVSYGAGVDNEDTSLTVTTGNSNPSMKQANDDQGDTCGLVDESLSNQMQENSPVLGKEIDNTERASQGIDVSIRESVDQDNTSDLKFVSSSCIVKGISDPIGEQEKGFNENNSRLTGIAVETDNTEKHCSHEISSGQQSPKEKHTIETCIMNSGEASSMPGMGESISTGDRFNKVAFALEPADCSRHSTISGTETKHLSEDHDILHEKSGGTLQGEGIEGFEIEGSDAVSPELCGNNETKQARVVQSPDQHKSLVGNDDLSSKSKSSLEAPSAMAESSLSPEVLCNPSGKDDGHNINHAADVPDNSTDCTVSGEKSVTDDMEGAKCIEKVEDGGHDPLPSVAVRIQACTEDIVSMQVDSPESNLDDFSHEKEGEKLHLDSSKMVCDDVDKEVGSTGPAEGVTVEKTTGLQPDSSIGNYPVLNTDVEDAKLAASCVEGDGLVDFHEHNPPSRDSGLQTEFEAHKQPSPSVPKEPFKSDVLAPAIGSEKGTMPSSPVGETESEAPKQPSPSVPKEPLKSNELALAIETEKGTMPGSAAGETESEAPKQPSNLVPKETFKLNELAPAIETEKGTMPGSAAGEMKASHPSISLLENFSVTMPNEASKELNEKMENSANVSTMQEDGVEAAPTKKPREPETERNCGTSSALPVTSCTVETDKSGKESVPGASCTDLSQSQVNKQAPLKSNNVENIGKVLTSEISGVNDPPKEEGTFTFDTRHLGGQSSEDSGKDLQSFPRLQACKLSLPGEGFPSVSGSSKMDQPVVKETSHVSSSTLGVGPPLSGGISERKSRRGSSSKSGKGSSKKGNLVKETSSLKQTEKGDKSSPLLSPSGTGQLMTFESSVKPKGAVSIPTSTLPDLNTSVPSSAFFQQPFTDLQQVQLRAQIFVYGSLIQGAAPDEACMVSAFDGGRSNWERSWRACVDRHHGQKSQGNNTGTPVPLRSGAKAQDQTSRFPQSEVLSSSTGRASNKASPSPVANPLIPPSSPLWSISTPSGEVLPPSSMSRGAVIDYQAISPLNPYSTPPMRNYIAHTTWPSQASPAPFPVPWLSSSQSSHFEISTNYPTFPITEPVKSTAVKESPLPITSGTKHVPPIPATHTGPTTMLPGASPLDLKKVKASTGHTGDTKTRKRKKSSGAEDIGQISVTASLSETVSAHAVANQLSNKTPAVEDLSQISSTAQNQVGLMSTSVVGNYYPTSVAVATPSSFVTKGSTDQAVTVVLPSVPGGHLNKRDLSTDKRALKFEGFSKVEEAKLQAEEAAAHSAAAISQCEGVWSQLDQQKSSGLTLDAQSKLASAAVAIAAAASVAKAAAAAAKIASNAAVQAKQMADEAVILPGTLNATAYDSNLVYNSMNLANASPGSILKGGDQNNVPNSAISAAREAARKRIEAASAATRHAENLDAIVKAAELAAEAVAHAGKVVAMGDPFSLSALAEAGPYNYWKVPQLAGIPGSKSNDMNKNKSVDNNAGEVPKVSNQLEGPDMDTRVSGPVVSPIQREVSRNVDAHVTLEENLIPSVKHGENSSKPYNDRKVSDPDTISRSNLSAAGIEEGNLVEVLKEHGDLKKAWITASAVSLKGGEVRVVYKGPHSEGSKNLSEWIPVEDKDGDGPKIRVPHPMTTLHFHGTRKRRRAAVKDYSWSVGDKVDAWLQEDCWCEGVVAEKDKKDATTFNIHFPAQGETLQVKVWNLRPSLVWSDGQWIEWSRPGQDSTSQGETPVVKRPKLGSTSIEAKGKAKMAKSIDFAETERNEEPRLPLSANEKVFNIGSAREGNKANLVRTMRSGLEREGSRVVFGVPKPGKKRKFMEVSKHYVSDQTAKAIVPNDSVKLSKLLMPQGSGSRGFRSNSKLDLKEKQIVDSKPRALKSGKPPSIPSRTLSRKDESTSSRRDASVSEHSTKGSVSNDENESSEQNPADVEAASASTMVFSSRALPRENRKKAVRNTKSERLNQGRLAPAGGRSARDGAAEKSTSEVAEPRRSNRRIQPTSRLLEGLQSSLIISKIPSSSNDKGHRSVNKSTARGNINRG